MRQLIGREGQPVEIRDNRASKEHAEKVSLGIGGMQKLEELEAEIDNEERELITRYNDVQGKIRSRVIAALKEQVPDITDKFWPKRHDAGPADIAYENIEEHVLDEHPDWKQELEAIKQSRNLLKRKRYTFGTRDKGDIAVGKEGTLIYSLVSGEHVAEELRYELAKMQEVERSDEKNKTFHTMRDRFTAVEEITAWINKLAAADKVADIHQIEVLPDQQGKKLAQELLDIARWDIEQTQRIAYTVARVLTTNHDQKKILRVFEKAGFTAIFCPGEDGGMTKGIPDYYLVIKEHQQEARE